MDRQPGAGSLVVARYPHRCRAATHSKPVEIAYGTRLEIISLEERWNNAHAMIVRDYEITIVLQVIDGSSAGEVVTDSLRGRVVTVLGEETPGKIPLPDWLVPASTSPVG